MSVDITSPETSGITIDQAVVELQKRRALTTESTPPSDKDFSNAPPDGGTDSDLGETSAVLEASEPSDDDESLADMEASEADVEPDKEEPDKEEPSYKVKVDGEEITVTLKELQSGYSRTKKFTQDMTALAREKEALKQIQAQTDAAREKYLSVLSAVKAEAEQNINTDWSTVMEDDPIEGVRMFAEAQKNKERLARIEAELDAERSTEREKEIQLRAQYLAAETEKLHTALPSWKDPDVRAREAKGIVDFALANGFSAVELSGLADHRLALMLRKAWLYDSTAKKASDALKNGQPITPTTKPGVSPPASKRTHIDAAQKRLQQTHSVDDAVALFRAIKNKGK